MRTTLTLDDDVAERLRVESRRTGRSFKETVNETLRRGLSPRRRPPQKPFRVRDIGFRLGVPFESTSRFLEELEGERF